VNLVKRLIEVGALKFGEFVLSSGKKSNVYVDIKTACTYPDILKAIASEISKLISDVEFDKIACIELGAVPIAVATAIQLGKPYVIFRKEKKDYGLGGDRIGEVKRGEKFVVVEDVVTTGKSIMSVVRRVEEAGGVVKCLVTVVDREESKIQNLRSVLKLSDLIKAKDLINSTKP